MIEDIDQKYATSFSRQRSTKGENIRRKFHRCMEFFLGKRGSCSHDNDNIDDDIEGAR